MELAALAAGGPLVLAFTKRDCGACVALAPALPRLAAIPGLAVAVVSQDPRPDAAAFAAAHGWAAPLRVLVDPEPWPASDAWATLATPTVVLVERGGRVAEVLEGWSRRDVNALAARAAALAGAAPVVVSPPGEGPDFRPG
ncbi:MAG: hypothetical protein QM704_14620 [Anaeromyxobacteraceae bacterium]